MIRWTAMVSVLLIACFGALPARAAEAPKTGTVSFVLENDLFYNIDRHYTNGVRFSWVPRREVSAPGWAVKLAGFLPWFPEESEICHGYALGQSMFTPGDITVVNPPEDERPYAGWLYGTIGLAAVSGKQLDQITLSVGIVGPASLAEESQKFVHEVIGSDEPRGWDTQLGNEPGFVLAWQRGWRVCAVPARSGLRLDFTPHVGAAVGNVFTYGNAGLTMRFGKNLPDDFGPPRIQPGMPGSGDFSVASSFRWYLFAGVEGRAVARNIFLDGNTFRDSRSVDKEPLVGDLQFGIVLDWPAVRLSYTHVLRTREFKTQDGRDDFGAMSVSVKY